MLKPVSFARAGLTRSLGPGWQWGMPSMANGFHNIYAAITAVKEYAQQVGAGDVVIGPGRIVIHPPNLRKETLDEALDAVREDL